MNSIRDKYEEELDRYDIVVEYFKENADRVSKNRSYLTNLVDSLKHIYFKNFRDTSYIGSVTNNLSSEVIKILEQEKKESVNNLKVKLSKIEASRKDKKLLINGIFLTPENRGVF